VRILDGCHNSVTARDVDGTRAWLHRKGAAPADAGLAVIPGSRGDFSFLVEPDPSCGHALWSIAHGAGRKIARGDARAKLKPRYRHDDLSRNPFGGRIVCGDEQLLWEEAPDCYKDAAGVVADLAGAGLLRTIAVLAPVVTFKTSLGKPAERQTPGGRDRRERHALGRRRERR
jgi:release factor H-coupled RctB family protein